MSISNSAVQLIETILSLGRDLNVVSYATSFLFFYDWLLTLSDEYHFVWKQRKSLVSVFYVLIRYSTLSCGLLWCLSNFAPIHSDIGCTVVMRLYAAIWTIGGLSLNFAYVVRCYAIWQRSLLIVGITGLLAISTVVLAATQFFEMSQTSDHSVFRTLAVCNGAILGSFPVVQVGLAQTILVFVFDTVIVGLTIAKTAQQAFESRRLRLSQGLSFYVLRDGIGYYLAAELLNLAVLITSLRASSDTVSSVINELQTAVASLLTQRLFLRLRQISEEEASPSQLDSRLGRLSFAHGTVIGNIGAPLRTIDEDPMENDAAQTEHDMQNQ